MLLRQGTRRLAFIAVVLLAGLASNELFAQTAACRAACDRDYGDHPGRFSACVNQCPRARPQARPQPSYSGGSSTDWNYCGSDTLGTSEERIRRCTSLIDSNLSPEDLATAYINHAQEWDSLKDFTNAIADYSEALKLKPNDQDVIARRAAVFRREGDHDRAINDYNLAIRLAPTAENYQIRCYGRAAANRDLEPALADCLQALRLKPNDAATLQSRGFVNFRLERLDDAMADLDTALRHKPGLAPALFIRGLIKLKRGDTTSGNADLAAAKTIEGDIADVFARYGLAPVAAATPAAAPAAPPPAVPTTAAADCAFSEVHWKSVETIGSVAAYLDHLKRFPNCAFADLARMKIEAMKK
jgi:tetratricopeptide (TPR) repeat protein